jgi:mannose-6-phosphate isomerase-like protein (cupin superfamily)
MIAEPGWTEPFQRPEGRVHTGTQALSIAHMIAEPGWTEPFQRPEFAEATIVLRGRLLVEHDRGAIDVGPGEVVLCDPGERVRYSNPFDEDTEYWSVCVPAFSPDSVHREGEIEAK